MTSARLLADQAVVVRDGKIVSVGADDGAALPARARVVDGRGLFLMPGLVDFHTHPAGVEELASYLLHGQTTIATLGGEGLGLRPRLGRAAAPNLLTSGATLDGNPPINRRFHAVSGAADVAAIVEEQRREGADFLKTYSFMTKPELEALADEGARRGLPIAGHTPRNVDASVALANIGIVAHGEEYFKYLGPPPWDDAMARVVALTVKNKVAVIPNLAAYRWMPRHAAALPSIMADPDTAFLPPAIYHEQLPANNRYANRPNIPSFVANSAEGLETLKRLTRSLHSAGVPLLAGTDAPIVCFPGRCLLDELELLHESGLSIFETLATATVNPGKLVADTMRKPDAFGTVSPGMRADLLLLGSNPLLSLDSLEDVKGVMVAGRWRRREEIVAGRERLRRVLAERHAVVDRYERLLVSDRPALFRYLATLTPRDGMLNDNVVIFDALMLDQEGKTADAIELLEATSRLMPRRFGQLNVLGQLLAKGGDAAGARNAFVRSLAVAPRNGVALSGLAALDAPSGARE